MFEVDGDIVRRLYFETGLSLRQFATATGLNIFTIRRLLLGEETRVTGRIVSALAKYFGVHGDRLAVYQIVQCQQVQSRRLRELPER